MRKYTLAVLGFIAACGGGGGDGQPDAIHPVDGAPGPDGGDPCDAHEVDDQANDQTPEETGLTLETELRICGEIDAREPDAADSIDVDLYHFEVAADGPVLVRVVAPGGAMLASVQGFLLDDTFVVLEGSRVRGIHAAFTYDAPAGRYGIVVSATNPEKPEAAVPYEVRIVTDDPATRCADLSGPPAYVESADGASSIDNDMIEVTWSPQLSLSPTASPADAPEASGSSLTVSAGMNYQATGTAALNVAAAIDDYQDRDTYVIASGSETNEMSIRVAWTEDADTDVDFFVFRAGELEPLVGGTYASVDSPEFATTSVLPSSSYWLWVGSYDGSTVPLDYTITLCGARFSP